MSGYSDIEKTRSVSGLTEQAKRAVHPYLQIIPARKNLAVRIRNIIIADLRLKVNTYSMPIAPRRAQDAQRNVNIGDGSLEHRGRFFVEHRGRFFVLFRVGQPEESHPKLLRS